jgi:plastocyanin domain-containing protein
MKTVQLARFIPLAFSSLALVSACSKSEASGPPNATPSIIADEHGFTPSSVAIPRDKPAAVTFTRTSDDTCAREVVFPDLKINEPLPLNKPVTINLPAGPARTFTFQCGMGMFKGKVVAN